jgi:hypothetical protein
MARADDVVSAALGHFDHSVAEGGEDAVAFTDDPEAVTAVNSGAVDDQLLTLGQLHGHPGVGA